MPDGTLGLGGLAGYISMMQVLRLVLRWLCVAAAAAAWSAAALAQEVPYDVEIVGVEGELRQRIEEISLLTSLRDRPPGTSAALRRRAQSDEETLGDVLRAHGHYAGGIEIGIDETASPVRVRIAVTPGPAFVLAAFRVATRDPDPAAAAVTVPLRTLGLTLGQPAVASTILDGEQQLLIELARRGYPLARLIDRRAVADFATSEVTVDVTVDSGPLARFGRVDVAGLDDVEARYVRRRLPWEQGEPFDLRQLELARKRLVATGLFASVRLVPGTEIEEGGRLPVRIELRERPHRSIGGGVSYSTSEGPGASVFWEHRNLFHEDEDLRVRAEYNFTVSSLGAIYRDPDFLAADQDLLLSSRLLEERTEAFTSTAVTTSAAVEWHLTETWRASAGLAFERSLEEENNRRRTFTLVSTPLQAHQDTTDDLLDPTRGGRFTLIVEPALEALGSSLNFVHAEFSDTLHLKVSEDPRIIAAGWARIGSIFGAETLELPANRRFYAGGGGSVRGYAFQMAGPVDAEGDPLGGRSLMSFGGEVRVGLTETIGAVGFLEAGNVYGRQLPSLGQDLLWGAGVGIRYFTPIGPVRADLAVPLNRRPDVDDPFQVYLSLGQAF